MHPLRVGTTTSQMRPSGLQELDAIEHLDARHPRIAGFGNDDIVLSLGPHQCPIGISAPDRHLRVCRRSEIAMVK